MSRVELYQDKPTSYFDNARRDWIDALPDGTATILEVGCGTGATGARALALGKASHYVGIELDPRAATLARQRLSAVVEGNVETLDLSAHRDTYDVLFASEVLEHLVDPWTNLRKLVECVKPGGLIFASSPNIASKAVVIQLLRGRFDYTNAGVMDRTHLRWFTPSTYRALLEQAGVSVTEVRPLRAFGRKAALINRLTAKRFAHLFHTQIVAVGHRAR